PEDVVTRSERVQLRPPVEVLERIVRAVVGAPAHEALEITPIVEILLIELAAGGNVLVELTLETRPSWCVHLRVDRYRDIAGDRRRAPDKGHQSADTYQDAYRASPRHRACSPRSKR